MSVVDAIAALEPASLTHLFWRDSEIQSAFTGNGESTLPLLTTPPLDAGDFGCFKAETLAVALPYNAQQPTPVSGACGQRVDPEVYEQTPSGEGCDYGSLLAIAVAVFPDDLYIVQDSDGVNIYYEFSCAQTEELVTQLTAWRPDFNTRFDAQLVTIENAVRVPEPCCGPGATLAALMVVAALGRRNRANAH